MALPRFVVLGTQKGGTTTLHHQLQLHPQVFLPECKELQFFSLHYAKGLDWYAAQFAPASPDQLCGDITPYYLFHPEVPTRLRECLPEARLVALLRDPVERALSGLFHSIRLGLEPEGVEQALALESRRLAGAEGVLRAADGVHRSHQVHSYVARSRYEQQLVRYRAEWEAGRLLLLRSEDWFARPEQIWPQILAFLGVEEQPLPLQPHAFNAGTGEASELPMALRRRLRAELEPTYQWMETHHGLHWDATL
jgi:hypothetical protein